MLLAGPTLFVMLFYFNGTGGDAKSLELLWRRDRDSDSDYVLVERELVAEAKLLPTTINDYPQFLGPRRQAVAGECWIENKDGRFVKTHLEKDWKAHPPRELWRQSIGAGWGSFAIVGDYAVTQEQLGGYECVTCLRVK